MNVDDEMILYDGFDDCILGLAHRYGMESVVAYDLQKVIDTLVERDGMTADDAWEYFSVNILGAWVGSRTPLFLECGDVLPPPVAPPIPTVEATRAPSAASLEDDITPV